MYDDARDWEIIWTPPYCPKFQPIERCWGFGKNDVALEYTSSRTIPAVARDLLNAWYAGVGAKTGKKKMGLTPELVGKFIAGSKKDMNEWIDVYGKGVSGTITNLTVEHVFEHPQEDSGDDDESGVGESSDEGDDEGGA